MQLLVENAIKKANGDGPDIIIDLGDKWPEAGERGDAMMAFGIGKKNFDIGFGGNLLVKCPKSKFKKLCGAFPIKEGTKYWMTTHYWADDTAVEGQQNE
jgi:hypothetical protein